MVRDAHSILGQFADKVIRLPDTIVLSVANAFDDSFFVSVESGNGVRIGTFHRKGIAVVLDHIQSAVFIDALIKVGTFGQTRLAGSVDDTFLSRFYAN